MIAALARKNRKMLSGMPNGGFNVMKRIPIGE